MPLALRAALAIALLIGFYVLAISVALGIMMVPLAEIVFLDRIHFKLAIGCAIAGLVILWSILPRIERFVAPGSLLERSDHPELFTVIDDVAGAAGQRPPAEVYLVHDVNAFVGERGGVMGLGSRRIMGIGLPLLQALSVSEFRAVIAHEFGHYTGGDTALGPWIYRTRSAIGRTVSNLDESGWWLLLLVNLPFKGFASLFMSVTLAISRAQEYAADALAARLEGPAVLGTSLRRIHGAALAYGAYFEGELIPVFESGHRPPIASGFQQFMDAPTIRTSVQTSVEQEMAQGRSSAHDTHPCLRDRLAALEDLPARSQPDDPRPAVDLLGDLPAAEEALLRAVLAIPLSSLTPLGWDEVGRATYLPHLREQLGKVSKLSGQAILDLDIGGAASHAPAGTPPQERVQAGMRVFQAAALVALADAGWHIDAPPAGHVQATRDGHTVVPWSLLEAIHKDHAPVSTWEQALRQAGVTEDVRVP